MSEPFNVNDEKIAEICRRWHIQKLSLFGSALRNELTPDSDIDLLIEFAENASPGFFDLTHLQDELSENFGRPVDLVSTRGLLASRNKSRREGIVNEAKVLYAA